MNDYLRFVDKLIPSVVNIYTKIAEKHPSSKILGRERMGTGIVVGRGDSILTVGYIVLGAELITVTLQDTSKYEAKLIDQDFESGLAILQIDAPKTPPFQLGDSDRLKVGDDVLVIASTGDSEKKVSKGNISQIGPFDAYWEYMLENAIKTTAVNPGLGGGALVDYTGRLVGVLSLNINEPQGSSLAIPINLFRKIYKELVEGGGARVVQPKSWLGFYIQPSEAGLVIFGLTENSPAAKAGLRVGDIILEINSKEVTDRVELYKDIWKHKPGDVISLAILRENETKTIEVVTEDRARFFS